MANGAITNLIESASASAAASTSRSLGEATRSEEKSYEEKRLVKPISELSRRDFLAASGAVVAASAVGEQLAAAATSPSSDSKLAIEGGPKAVQEIVTPAKRWG